jgi:adenosine deaminase
MTPEAIRRAPKVLLHDHLDGGLRPQTVIELADTIGYQDQPNWAPGSATPPTPARSSATWRPSPTPAA